MEGKEGLVGRPFARNMHVKIKIGAPKNIGLQFSAQNRTRTCTPRSTRT